MINRNCWLSATLLCLALASCSNAAPEPVGKLVSASSPLSSGATPDLLGYSHDLRASAFAVGAIREHLSDSSSERYVGSFGVLARNASSGSVLGIPNSDAPCLSEPPALDFSQHAAKTRSYFSALGLPDTQIGGTLDRILQSQAGGAVPATAPVTVGRVTVLRRVVGGIPVQDSFAWAHFTQQGTLCGEEVYWPRLPGSVIAEAQALAAVVSDPAQATSLRARLPAGEDGHVSIRHSSPYAKKFEAFASYDLIVGGTTRHFDLQGLEQHLSEEALVDVQTAK